MEDSTNPAVPPASRCWMGGFFLLVEDDDDDDASSLPLLNDDDDDDDEVEVEVAIKLLLLLIPLPPTFRSASTVRPVQTLLASMLVPLLVIRLEDDGIMVYYYLCAVY